MLRGLFADMSAGRRMVVITTLVVPVVAALVALVMEGEWWPLSAYRMYSRIESGVAITVKALVVDEAGNEAPVSSRLEPKRTRLERSVQRLERPMRDRLARQMACQHDRLRRRGEVDGPAKALIRIYTLRWNHQGDPEAPITRRLVAESRCRP
jgi:hypothetical protein